ncbi:MAG: glycosyltransferase [Syntrophomonadaceae bacterium]
MRILLITGDRERHLNTNFYDMFYELSKIAELTIWHAPGEIKEILNSLKLQPDFIFINEYGELAPKVTGLSSLSIPYGVLLHDLHHRIDLRKESLRRDNVQHIFSISRDKFFEWYPEFAEQFHWLPHPVNTDIFKDYQLAKDINYLIMGVVSVKGLYSLRYKMLMAMQNKPGFVFHEHPGYRRFTAEEKSRLFFGERYAREINRAKMFLTCGSKYNYSLSKYYEVLACNTLLLAPATQELYDLGFVPEENFVAVTESNFEEKAEYYLQHEEERLAIARQGYEMVRARHSAVQRAKEMVDIITGILGQQQS